VTSSHKTSPALTSSKGSSQTTPSTAVTSSERRSSEISSPSNARTPQIATVQAVISAPERVHVTLTVRPLKPVVVEDAKVHECRPTIKPLSSSTTQALGSAAVKTSPTTPVLTRTQTSTSQLTGQAVSPPSSTYCLCTPPPHPSPPKKKLCSCRTSSNFDQLFWQRIWHYVC